ncbi:MAG: IS66 family transposase [Ardenticatenaceae bacterium]
MILKGANSQRVLLFALFLIGSRSWEKNKDALDGFAGWLMSDGYRTYRRYALALRCLAHLIRKARGFLISLDRKAQNA